MAGIGLSLLVPPAWAYDVNDKLSIGGIAAWGGQCQELTDRFRASSPCRGALPFRPHLSYRPTQQDVLSAELSFAAGNGLNGVSAFRLSPWAADLEDDVKDINGRGRNYLVTAWYRHDLLIAKDNALSVTLGIIDATDFLDNNAFANDEYTQFMNEGLVNSPQVFLPSYDLGGALQWELGPWSVSAVYMNVGMGGDDNEDGEVGRVTNRDVSDDYDYFGTELGYSVRTALGEGNYRIAYSRTSKDFLDPSATHAERRVAMAMSFDQELGNHLGAFLRTDTQFDRAAVDFKYYYAGGLQIRGSPWGRENDNIGLGVAYLHGGNLDIKSTRLAEAYYRFVIRDRFALTADLQYMHDEKRIGEDPKGFILGLRADAYF